MTATPKSEQKSSEKGKISKKLNDSNENEYPNGQKKTRKMHS